MIELKLDSSAAVALEQIRDKQYFKPYLNKGKEALILGANFCSKNRNISDWKGELLSQSGEKIRDIFSEQ